jgi:outer membrane lipoprotein carrier protein
MTTPSLYSPLRIRSALVRKARLCRIFWLGLGLAAMTTGAWAVELDDVVHALETPFQANADKNTRIFDYSADFSQESRIASLDRRQKASGLIDVAFADRGPEKDTEVKFRWLYLQPTTQEIVSDGKTLWVYLPENNQVIQSDIGSDQDARQNDPMIFLTGLGNLSRDFQVNWASPRSDDLGNHVLELTPRQASPMISRLVIVVDRLAVQAYLEHKQKGGASGVHFPILSTTVYDPNGNSTVITFSNLRVNLGIPGARFTFIIPEGVQVVRPPGSEAAY